MYIFLKRSKYILKWLRFDFEHDGAAAFIVCFYDNVSGYAADYTLAHSHNLCSQGKLFGHHHHHYGTLPTSYS